MIRKPACDVVKVFAFVFCLLVGLPVALSLADGLPLGEYDLVLPGVQEKATAYDSDLQRYRVSLQGAGATQYLIPKSNNLDWFVSGEPRMDHHALEIRSNGRNQVLITGLWRKGEGLLRVDLAGTIQGDKCMGSGTLALGADPKLKEFPMVYRVNWGLFPINANDVPEVSTRVEYEGEPPCIVQVQAGSYEDVQKDLQSKPPMNVLSIKALSYETPDARRHRIERLSKAEREYLESILSELTWAEIKVAPGIIMMIDHLAKLEEPLQQNVAEAYVRDGTSDYLAGFSYRDIKNLPAPLLLVHCYPRLDENAKAEIKNASKRFELLLDEAEISSDTSPQALEKVMSSVLSSISEDERKQYFHESRKLNSFVRQSQNDILKAYLPEGGK